jgi:O-acetyl-ADP-ribose deacetylase (regulator of RNase III)
MIERTTGNILAADAEAIVNTVNCVGVMGRGLALQFRKTFPCNYDAYRVVCNQKKLRPGVMLTYELHLLKNPRFIINFPTKRHWKDKSRIEDIASGLEALVAEIRKHNIRSIALPPLGCGLGGLNWAEVHPMVVRAFAAFPDLRVLLYEPADDLRTEEMH